jgi:hypothetical protein
MEEMITEYNMIAKQRLEIVLRINANDNVILLINCLELRQWLSTLIYQSTSFDIGQFSMRLSDSISLLIQEE